MKPSSIDSDRIKISKRLYSTGFGPDDVQTLCQPGFLFQTQIALHQDLATVTIAHPGKDRRRRSQDIRRLIKAAAQQIGQHQGGLIDIGKDTP